MKRVRFVKNLSILLLLFVLIVPIKGIAQERFTFDLGQTTMKEVLNKLKSLSGVNFVYNTQEVDDQIKVNGRVSNLTLEEAVVSILGSTSYSYEKVNDYILIKRKEETKRDERLTISGTVLDDDGLPMPGVAVMVEGTSIGVATDLDGRFRIENRITKGSTLLFSCLGFEQSRRKVDDEAPFTIQLEKQEMEIDEVVVTGYQTVSRKSYTGASRTILGEELKTAGNQNVLHSLKNLDPSFALIDDNIMGSNPNVLPEFTIRGQSSLAGLRDDYTGNPNMPLFVMDGFEVSVEKVFDMDIYRINSITILKDAAATAIYGSRAANGVVVIETISPEPTRLYVNYNTDITFSFADLTGYDLLNGREKLEFEILAGIYEGNASNSYYHEMMLDVYNERLRNVESGYDTYWLNKPINPLTVGHKHTLRIDGGSDNFRYAIDASFNDQKGVMKKSGRTRESLGMEFKYLYNDFTFSNEITYGSTLGTNSPYGAFSTYARLNPYYRYEDEDGRFIPILDQDRWAVSTSWQEVQYNPLYNTTLNTIDNSRYDEFQNKFNVIWTPLQGLTLRGNLSIFKQNRENTLFKPAKHTDFASWSGDNYDRRGVYNSLHGSQKTIEAKILASYQKAIDKHVLTLNGLWEIRDREDRWEQVIAEGFPNENLNDLGSALQYQKDGVPRSGEEQRRLVGFFLSTNYIYADKYMVDLTGRLDASSEFGADSRWAPFWSGGIGWNMHNEEFMKGLTFVDRFKLRASYGLTGSVNYNPYQAMTTYQYLTGTRYHFGQGASLLAMGNDLLGWQKTHEQNFGFDLDMFNERIQIFTNYYAKVSKDVVTTLTLAPSTGFTSYMDNLGEIANRGFEAGIRVDAIKDLKKGLVLNLFATITGNKNKLNKLSNSLKSYNTKQDDFMEGATGAGTEDEYGKRNRPRVRFIEGAPINSIWVNPSLGIDAASGQEIFLLPDGNTTNIWSANNYVIGGCLDPKLMGTFGFNFSYKGFRVNTHFYYSYGGDIYNQTLIDKVQDADFRFNVDRRALTDRWWSPGDISKYTANTGINNNTNAGARTKPTSRFIERNNYLEMSSLNITYEFAPAFIKKIYLSRLNVGFYMNDLFRASTVVIERGTTYPFARNFSIGIQAKF